MIKPPPGGWPDGTTAPRAYLRPSKIAKVYDDGIGVMWWYLWHVCLGLSRRPDLMAVIRGLDYGDPRLDGFIIEASAAAAEVKRSDRWPEILQAVIAATKGLEYGDQALKAIVVDLIEQGKRSEAAQKLMAANWGTVIHAWTEPDAPPAPPQVAGDIQAYHDAMKRVGLVTLERNIYVVDDRRQLAGELDEVTAWERDGTVRIADLKSGQKPGRMNLLIQLDAYAGAQRYNAATGERSPIHPALDTEHAWLVHVPLGKHEVEVRPLDLSTHEATDAIDKYRRGLAGYSAKLVGSPL